ncbi:MAG: cupin domain-containing protein [Chloroflexota bacterium]
MLARVMYRIISSGQGKTGWHPGASGVDSRFLIDGDLTGRFRLKLNSAPPGNHDDGHSHRRQEHAVYVVSGQGQISLDQSEWQDLHPGDAIYIGPGVHHRVQVLGEEPFVCLMLDVPPEDAEPAG